MQKLIRLRALIQGSPLSSNDVFVPPKTEPYPVVQSPSPVKESTPQNIRISRNWTSPAQSAHSTLGEPLHPATILLPKLLRRALSRTSSPLPSLMSSKGNRKAERGDMSTRKKEGMASVVSGTGPTGPNLKTIWSENDSYLPRAKPPPPLKRIKHARNRSENEVSSLNPTIPSRPPTSRQSSGSSSTASCSSRRSLDVPSTEVSNEDSNQPADDVQRTLTRIGTRSTIASGASEDSDIIFASSSPNWQPPNSWTGPSKAVSADEDHGTKLGGWFARKRSVQSSSKGGSMRAPTGRLNRVRSVAKMMTVHLADTGEPEEQEASVIRRGTNFPSDVMVKIKCYEGDGWHETPMADIIPKLRELKFK